MNRVSDFEHIWPQTLIALRGWEVQSPTHDGLGAFHPVETRIYVRLTVDAWTVGEAQGATLGEALLNLGAMMVGERLIPASLISDAIGGGS